MRNPLLLPFSPRVDIVLASLRRCLRRLSSLQSLARGSRYNFDPHTTTWGSGSGWGPATWPSFPPLSGASSDSDLASDSHTDDAGSTVDDPIDYTSNASSERVDVASSSGTLSANSAEWGSTLPLGDVVSGTDLSGEWARISAWGTGTPWNADDLDSILRAPSPLPAGESSTVPPSPAEETSRLLRSPALERWVGFRIDVEPIEQAWAALNPLPTSMKVVGPGIWRDALADLPSMHIALLQPRQRKIDRFRQDYARSFLV
ncbi:hypothetical protein B0H14DRAFT_3482700 [Mycena olivaceomarginata]|nr:hypothetical protein B0H14DRAFT_3482700 [Mycena olivaceomarginata]